MPPALGGRGERALRAGSTGHSSGAARSRHFQPSAAKRGRRWYSRFRTGFPVRASSAAVDRPRSPPPAAEGVPPAHHWNDRWRNHYLRGGLVGCWACKPTSQTAPQRKVECAQQTKYVAQHSLYCWADDATHHAARSMTTNLPLLDLATVARAFPLLG